MISLHLPAELETALLDAAQRSGLSLDSYMAQLCSLALLHERIREQEHAHALASRATDTPAAPALTRQRVSSWLHELAGGHYSSFDTPLPAGRPRRNTARPATTTCVTPAMPIAATPASTPFSSSHPPPP